VEILIEYKTTFKQDRLPTKSADSGHAEIMAMYRNGIFLSPANNGTYVPVEFIKFIKLVAKKEG
jgi:hypothetical protein